jgi:single-stranded-DNA-specific exonuclease
VPIRQKRWVISAELPPGQAARFRGIHPVVAQILYNRGYRNPEDARAFLLGNIPVADPFKMRGMNKAVERIRRAIKKGELIVVYGDFDADGVTSTALLVSTLKALGANVKHYIPNRVDEGYGLNDGAMIGLAQRGTRVLITVDCGIRSIHEVETGKNAGMDMIVTDHHSVGPEVPDALAVINPKQENCAYPEKMLAGVGIAFQLASALIKVSVQQDRREPPFDPETLLDLVAIGTVADLAPLSHPENRAFVIRGLKQLQTGNRLGVRALLDVASLTPQQVDAMNIGFALGPRINAAGRLDDARVAYELLTTANTAEAAIHAQRLEELNVKRQNLTRDALQYVKTTIDPNAGDVPLVFTSDPNFPQGIVGLIAGRLTEEFYRPAVVLQQGPHESHGSCRSIPEFNITEALDRCADLLLRHGGHAQAAGFAIDNVNIPQFQKRLVEIAAEGLRDKPLQPALNIDVDVAIGALDMALYEALETLQPCGHDHAAPILCTRHLCVADSRKVGRDENHLKLKFTDGYQEQDAIAFGFGELADRLPRYVDVAYQLDINEWNGERRLQMRVLDLRETRS